MSDVDSTNGIKITVDAPTGNDAMLNIKRPMCMRQEYGDNVPNKPKNSMETIRYFYGSPSNKNGYSQVGTLLQDQYTRPMPDELKELGIKLMKIVQESDELKRIESKNMRNYSNISFLVPNHCSVLIYYGLDGYKDASTLSFHCDNTYTCSGKFSVKKNTQTEDTPTITLTMGSDRVIHYQRRYSNGGKWEIDATFSHSETLKHGTIGIVHPDDERPFKMNIDGKIRNCQYQHGNIRISRNKLSVALVFRHVSTFSGFSTITSKRMFNDAPSLKDEYNHVGLHKEANKVDFQQKIQSLYKKVFVNL